MCLEKGFVFLLSSARKDHVAVDRLLDPMLQIARFDNFKPGQPAHALQLRALRHIFYLDKYDTWSSYKPEEEGVVIAYTSVYGNTEKAVFELESKLREKGVEKVFKYDISRSDTDLVVGEAFRYSKLVLATTTYNMDIFPPMRKFIDHLTIRNFQNREIGLIENGSWAPTAAKVMKGMLEKSKDLRYMDTVVTVRSGLNEVSLGQIEGLAEELAK